MSLEFLSRTAFRVTMIEIPHGDRDCDFDFLFLLLLFSIFFLLLIVFG
jgi:hypothetical protein